MLTAEELETRRAIIADSEDLPILLARIAARARPLLARPPVIPSQKALLSVGGGRCPKDGSNLLFDPWSPAQHRCGRCAGVFTGERHDRSWARFQHLWLSERMADLAALAALGDNDNAGDRAIELLTAYGELYPELPNKDNVLGPSHLFFSTYLESIWISNYLAAATLLQASGRLDEETGQLVGQVADEAAALIGEFNEGYSNRQVWNSAALVAIGSWFKDDELIQSAATGRTGLLGLLTEGFGADGSWYEGENYHLFALRGMLTGLCWSRFAGVGLLDDPELRAHLALALRAPTLTALPDFRFPARKDSRFGISLAQPMYLEGWEVGRALGEEAADEALAGWLAALYGLPAQAAETFDSYLHEVGEPAPPRRARTDLSWWALIAMPPTLPAPTEPWSGASVFLPAQGLAIFRQGDQYLSLECGTQGGGHGHDDRLNLTLHAGGVYWLPDFGTGSYVTRDLFWYRSTLAHNAPMFDGRSQPGGSAVCEMFEIAGDWGWVSARWGECRRSVVRGPHYMLDIVEYAGADEHSLQVPWHIEGEWKVETSGHWEPAAVDAGFVGQAERFSSSTPGSVIIRAAKDSARLRLDLVGQTEVMALTGPGVPWTGRESRFLLAGGTGRAVKLVAVLGTTAEGTLKTVRVIGDLVEIDTPDGTDRHSPLVEGWQVDTGGAIIRLGGRVPETPGFTPLFAREVREQVRAAAPYVQHPPALDGTPSGFVEEDPLLLDTEDQYRRSEEPYPGPEEFSARALVNRSDEELFCCVEVVKPELVFRVADAETLGLDNEPDDIHSDGIQLYLALGDEILGFLVVPSTRDAGLRVSAVGGTGADPAMVRGAWRATEGGYAVTLAITPGWSLDDAGEIGLQLVVNEMHVDRQRRAGQLAWTGGNGWVYLRGDREDTERFGRLELR